MHGNTNTCTILQQACGGAQKTGPRRKEEGGESRAVVSMGTTEYFSHAQDRGVQSPRVYMYSRASVFVFACVCAFIVVFSKRL